MKTRKTSFAAIGLGIALFALGTPSVQAGTCGSTCTAADEKATTYTSYSSDRNAASDKKAASKDIVQTAAAAGQFKTLLAAAEAAGLVDVLKGDGPLTVLAPTDDAFKALPEGTVEALLKPENKHKLAAILTYHVIAGQAKAQDVVKLSAAQTVNGQRIAIMHDKESNKVMLGDATVIKADIMASNGVIHVIDKVLLPSDKDIVATAATADTFKTLVAAVQAAELVEALKGDGPFTVFAPTDEAFAKLPAGTFEALLQPENRATLQAILKHHVIPARVYSDAAAKGATVKTLNGTELTTRSTKSGVTVNNANIVAVDIDATNGVIHVIDTVLIPSARGAAAASDSSSESGS